MHKGTVLYDFGSGREFSWIVKLIKIYGIKAFCVDNGADDDILELSSRQSKRAYRQSLLNTKIWLGNDSPNLRFARQSYLAPLPDTWPKADIIVLNFPLVRQRYLQDVIMSNALAKALYTNLKPGAVFFILSEAHMYFNVGSPYLKERYIVKEEMLSSMSRVFGVNNTCITPIPAGYNAELIDHYGPLQQGAFKRFALEFFFLQGRKQPDNNISAAFAPSNAVWRHDHREITSNASTAVPRDHVKPLIEHNNRVLLKNIEVLYRFLFPDTLLDFSALNIKNSMILSIDNNPKNDIRIVVCESLFKDSFGHKESVSFLLNTDILLGVFNATVSSSSINNTYFFIGNNGVMIPRQNTLAEHDKLLRETYGQSLEIKNHASRFMEN